MSQFSRRARWLNELFPASVAPQKQDPGRLSDDVSLVQPYDSGGLGFQEPRTFCRRFVIPIGASNAVDMITLSEDEIFRIFALDSVQLAGQDATVLVRITSGSGDSVYIAARDILQASTNPQPFPLVTDVRILGPGQTLAAETISGGAASQFTVGVYGALAPLGTVFYN